MDFVFASTVGQLGLNRTNETLDGDIAYNIGGAQPGLRNTGTFQKTAGSGDTQLTGWLFENDSTVTSVCGPANSGSV